jgi:hypothetical protein
MTHRAIPSGFDAAAPAAPAARAWLWWRNMNPAAACLHRW